MLSFFKMNQLLFEAEQDWRDFFGLPPAAAPSSPQAPSPTAPIQTHGTAIAGRQVEAPPPPAPSGLAGRVSRNMSVDPNALLGQRDKKAVRQNVKPTFPTTKIGRTLHGDDVEAITQRERDLNMASRAGEERDDGPGFLDSMSSRILKQVEDSPNLFQPGKAYTLQELQKLLAPTVGNAPPQDVIRSLFHLARQGKYGPFQHKKEIGMGGKTVHQFIFQQPQGTNLPKLGSQASFSTHDRDEDKDVLNPYGRQVNRAQMGGRANKVGYNVPEAPPQDRASLGLQGGGGERTVGVSTPVDAAVSSFKKAQDALNDMMQSGVPSELTRARGLLVRMKEMHQDALRNFEQMRASTPDDPEKAKKWKEKLEEWESLVKGMEMELKAYPADLGLSDDRTAEYKPAVKRRRVPHDQAVQGAQTSRPKPPASPYDDELDAELNRDYPHTAPRREWAYYPV